jgi:hypothetical protein
MKVSELLTQALALFGPNGEHWTKETYARDMDNNPVSPVSKEACRWCALGAIRHCLVDVSLRRDFMFKAHDFLQQGIPVRVSTRFPWEFNDLPRTTFSDVKTMYQLAIAYAEKQELEKEQPSK